MPPIVLILVAVLAVVAAMTLLAPRLHVPPPILLACAGVALAFVPGIHRQRLSPDLILIGFLPPLLYADAFATSWRDFQRWLRPITMLAVGLVAATILSVGLVAHQVMPDLPWSACFLLGAVVSPTDTVAVQSVLERLRIPRRMTAVLGGESLVNDATGLVGVQLGVAVVLQGAFSTGAMLGRFVWVAGVGIGVGVTVGALAALLNRRVREAPVLFTLSLLAPYLAYVTALELEASGVLAVVASGFLVAWRIHHIPSQSRVRLYAGWEFLEFLLNGFCFVYIGMEAPYVLRLMADSGECRLWAGLLVSGAVIATRVLWCLPMAYLPLWLWPRLRAREGGYPPLRSVLVVSWCGVRGAVSLAAALALPAIDNEGFPFPGRDAIEACTLAVILCTLLLQGLTLHPLVKLLRIPDDPGTEEEARRAREQVLQAGIARLDAFCSEHSCPVAVHRYREAMADQLAALEATDAAVRSEAAQRLAVSQEVRREVHAAQEAALLLLRNRGQINDQLYSELLLELDRLGIDGHGASE